MGTKCLLLLLLHLFLVLVLKRVWLHPNTLLESCRGKGLRCFRCYYRCCNSGAYFHEGYLALQTRYELVLSSQFSLLLLLFSLQLLLLCLLVRLPLTFCWRQFRRSSCSSCRCEFLHLNSSSSNRSNGLRHAEKPAEAAVAETYWWSLSIGC